MTSRKPELGRSPRPMLHVAEPLTEREREIARDDFAWSFREARLELAALGAIHGAIGRSLETIGAALEQMDATHRRMAEGRPTIAPSRPNHAQAWLLDRVVAGLRSPFLVIRDEAKAAGIDGHELDRAYNALRSDRLIGIDAAGRLIPLDAEGRLIPEATAPRPDAAQDHECRACGFVWTTPGEDLTGCARCYGDDVSSRTAESDADLSDREVLRHAIADEAGIAVEHVSDQALDQAKAAIDRTLADESGAYRYVAPPAPLDILGRMTVGRSHGPACGDEVTPALERRLAEIG